MAHARHVHQLSYAAGQITVQVYMRQNFFRRSAVNTTFIHWPKLGSRFFKETCTLVCRLVALGIKRSKAQTDPFCSGSDADTYDFPTLDRVIAGEDDGNPNPFRSSFRYVRSLPLAAKTYRLMQDVVANTLPCPPSPDQRSKSNHVKCNVSPASHDSSTT